MLPKKQTLVAIVLATAFVIVEAQTKPKELSEVSKLKAENLRLSAQLNQCQIQNNAQALKESQQKLEQEFTTELGCKKFDWQVLGCADDKKDSSSPSIK